MTDLVNTFDNTPPAPVVQYDPEQWKQPDLLPNGMYLGVPDEVYHALPYASFHRLAKVAFEGRTWAHYRAALEQEQKTTEAMARGTALHLAVLQPDVYSTRVVDGPVNSKTGAGYGYDTKTFADAQEILPDALLLPRETRYAVDGMANALRANANILKLLRAPDAHCYETTGIVDLPVLDDLVLRCKFRPDLWIPGMRNISDIKSTKDASPLSFAKDIARYHYHGQAALYMHLSAALGYPIDCYGLLCVENEQACWTPQGLRYGTAVYELEYDSIAAGWRSIVPVLTQAAQCYATNSWPGYPDDVLPISVPHWAMGPTWDY